MTEPIRVLHAEDDAEVAALAAEFLERENERLEVVTAADTSSALDRLRTDAIDCVVSDYDMPDADGVELLESVRDIDDSVPFILFTGKGSEEVASEALARGATDYLQKGAGTGQYALLANRIENAVVQRRSVAELEHTNDILEEAFSLADLGVCEYDGESGELWFSEGIAELFDADGESWVRSDVDFADILEAFHPDHRQRARATVERAFETHEVTEFDARLDASPERWLRIRCKPIEEGGEIRRVRAVIRNVTDQIIREREMESRERLMERMGLAVYGLDAEGTYTYVNPAGERFTGYDREDILGSQPDLFHPRDHVEEFEAAIAELVAEDPEGVRTVEATIQRKDGEEVPIEVVLTVLTDEDGAYAGSVGVAQEIAGRKETERRLREYESILRAIPDEVSIVDTEGYHIDVIPPTGASVTDSGHDPEELRGEHISEAMPEDDVERAAEFAEELVTTDRDQIAFEMDVRTKDGERLPRENHMSLLEDDDGSVRGTVSVLRDIEARKRRERELERYARLIEASGDAVYALDAEGAFTFSNEAHQEIVDRPEEEVLGAHASIALPDEAVENGQALIQELLGSDRNTGTYEMEVLRPDGERIPTENHVALLTDEDGEFRGTVGVLRDISERKAHERELERQNERLERFAEIASHDLRNPLNVAQGHLELAMEGDADGEPLRKIDDALDRMDRLIDDTLTMARQGASVDDPTAIDLADLVAECWEAVGGDGDLTVVDSVTIRADEMRGRQALENLLRNASEHGGEDVSVRVGAIDGEGFYVEDDGPGVPADEREDIFDVGYTTAPDGTGFGLAIVAEIVQAHGWMIDVTERENGGARFEVTGVDVVE